MGASTSRCEHSLRAFVAIQRTRALFSFPRRQAAAGVHRSHIVSLPYAVELVKSDESVNLVMDDAEQTPVPVSRSKTAQLKELLGVV